MTSPLPPFDELAERAVLASLLIDRDAIIHVAPILGHEDFYLPPHQQLYASMLHLYHRRTPVDLVTMEAELRQSGLIDEVGGIGAVAALMSEEITAVHASYYAGIVRDCAARRRAAAVGEVAIRAAFDTSKPVATVYAEISAALAKAATGAASSGYLDMKALMDRAYERFHDHEERLIPFGISALDSAYGEMRPNQLTVIAARPSVGKSALAAQIAFHNAVKKRRPVGFISLEMTADEIAERFLSLASGANMYLVRTRQASQTAENAVMAAIGKLNDCPFFCDDRVSPDLFQVQNRAREMASVEGIELLIVDYLQLMTTNAENRTQQVSQISRGLKQLARELNIPVVALAQLNRNIEGRTSSPKPMLSDLRESGSIEQDADRVIFIHRPDLYDANAEKNVAELLVAKHRNGPTGAVRVSWLPERVQFGTLTNREDA